MSLQNKTVSYIGIVAFVFIVGAVIVFSNTSDIAHVISNTEGDTASFVETPYTDLGGNPVDLDEFSGKALVVNSWASWCPFCVQELPDFDLLGEEFKNDVVVVAINRRESASEARTFLNSIDNPENIEFWLDSGDAFYRSIGGFAMPETLFLDREGNISFHKRGFMTLEEMRSHTETALNQ